MRLRRLEREPEPDSRLDPFRPGVARLYDDHDELVGIVATRVQVWWTIVGPWWRHRGVRPVEIVEWLLTFEDTTWPARHSDGWDDGVEEDIDGLVAERIAGRFTYAGIALRAEWLIGNDAVAAYDRYGWGS
ncbi:MAG: hypothetical protein QOK14_935 [Frankiaceae bacterium]|nr:hypothetical protein [Frankiaceae bacterium]